MKNIFKQNMAGKDTRAATPALARQHNIRKVLDIFRSNPALSRAEVTRLSGISSPTMTKLFTQLLKSGLIRETSSKPEGPGRPSKIYTMSEKKIQVFAAVIGVKKCRIFTAPLTLELKKTAEHEFYTPGSYEELIHQFREFVRYNMESVVDFLGLGLTTSGLINSNEQKLMICPNIRFLDGKQPALDITRGFNLRTITVHEEQSLCIAEQVAGNTGDLTDFAMLDVREGMGVGVVSGGNYLTGQCGFSGEIGHIPVVLNGLKCGCGKSGCLETVATDTALLKQINDKYKLQLNFPELIKLLKSGKISISTELEQSLDYLSRGIAIIINMHNPGLVLVNSKMFDLDPEFLARLIDRTAHYSMTPSMNVCSIKRTSASRDAGVLACISNTMVNSIIDPQYQ